MTKNPSEGLEEILNDVNHGLCGTQTAKASLINWFRGLMPGTKKGLNKDYVDGWNHCLDLINERLREVESNG